MHKASIWRIAVLWAPAASVDVLHVRLPFRRLTDSTPCTSSKWFAFCFTLAARFLLLWVVGYGS